MLDTVSKDQATLDSYDGVELRFLNGVTRKCAPLTVAQAAHYLRLESQIRDGELAAVRAFVLEFVEHVGAGDVRLVDLGLEVEGAALSFGDMTVREGLALTELVATATGDDAKAARAQVQTLDKFPRALGFIVPTPAEVFEVARAFTDALYLHIYGLASDFSDHLTRSPRVKVLTIRAPAGSCSMPASMT